MRLADLLKLKKVLDKIKEPDANVEEMKAAVQKDIAIYDARRGQIKENYELGPWD